MRQARARVAYALLAVVLIMVGCSAHPVDGSPQVSPSAERSLAADQSGDRLTARSMHRPIEPIPAVRPNGMVDPPPGKGMARYTTQTITWRPCGTQGNRPGQCATVLAPLDYRHPDRTAVTIAIARRSTGSTASKGAIFTNPGGPGASGTNFLAGFNAHGLERSYDLVSWDPRGAGRSTPVECFDNRQMDQFTAFDYSPDNAAELQQLIDWNAQFGRACLAQSGELLEHISTADTARDLDLLRGLLGQRRLNYLGFSYGTSIGAMYATLFPQNVGHMVLDGATDIGGKPRVSQVYGFNRTLDEFASWCAQQQCRLGSTQQEVLQTISGFLTRMDQTMIPAGRRDLTQALATSGLLYALYSPASRWPTVLNGLQAAIYDDDGRILLAWADAYYQRNSDGDFGQFNSAFPAIRCLDDGGNSVVRELKDWQADERAAPTLGSFIGPDLSCATWPVRATGDTERKISYSGRTPIVIVGTTGDPATPYEWARHMHRALASSRLITLHGDGHLAFDQSACAQQKVLAFFVDDRTPSDSSCTDG